MIKHSVSVIAIVALSILAGCTSSKVAYRSKATLTPAATAGQYEVAFLIEDISDPANPSVVVAPRMGLGEGKEGSHSAESPRLSCQTTSSADRRMVMGDDEEF